MILTNQSTVTLSRNRNRDQDNQTDDLNNLNLEKMKTRSKRNLSNMEQKELLTLRNDETMVFKLADKDRILVIPSTGHYESIIIQSTG